MGSLVVLQDWVRIAGNSASAVAVAMPAPWPEVSQHEVLLSLLSLRGVTTTAPDTLTFSLRTVTNDDASDNTVILPGTELWAIGALTSNAFYKKALYAQYGGTTQPQKRLYWVLSTSGSAGPWSVEWRLEAVCKSPNFVRFPGVLATTAAIAGSANPKEFRERTMAYLRLALEQEIPQTSSLDRPTLQALLDRMAIAPDTQLQSAHTALVNALARSRSVLI